MVGFRGDEYSAIPFPAIVGQDRLKRALLGVAVSDELDGLLIRGEKGTAKSTAVRALADLLPTQTVVADCPYGCPPDEPERQCKSCRSRADLPLEERPVPVVTVPLGATRERIVGSLSVSDAMDGDVNFDPGLLARANRGFLYVDEVNLLDDHLVDVLLDAAASGLNRVERDGMSVTHPADFTLLGTMNPEEGDIRPQLRDRFAIQATVSGATDPAERVEILETAISRDATSAGTDSEYQPELREYRESIADARRRIEDVALPREYKVKIAEVCADAGVDGHRGDIAAARTALAFAALDGRSQVLEPDIREALELALPHRMQRRPFEESTDFEDILADHFDDEETPPQDGEGTEETTDSEGAGEADAQEESADISESREEHDSQSQEPNGTAGPEPGDGNREDIPEDTPPTEEDGVEDTPRDGQQEPSGNGDGSQKDVSHSAEQEPADADPAPDSSDVSETVRPTSPAHRPAPVGDGASTTLDFEDGDSDEARDVMVSGRMESEPSAAGVGPRIRTEPAESTEEVNAAASVREAAKNGRDSVDPQDLRKSINAGRSNALVVFAVDASASMRPAIEAAKGTVMELLKEAYQARDEVAFVAFAGSDAEVLLPPTDSVTLAARHLKQLPTGERTPLPAGLESARDVIDRADPTASVAVVVTDGRTNVADGSPTEATRSAARSLNQVTDQVLVVDSRPAEDRVGLIDEIVDETDGRVIPLAALSRDSVTKEVDRARNPTDS